MHFRFDVYSGMVTGNGNLMKHVSKIVSKQLHQEVKRVKGRCMHDATSSLLVLVMCFSYY